MVYGCYQLILISLKPRWQRGKRHSILSAQQESPPLLLRSWGSFGKKSTYSWCRPGFFGYYLHGWTWPKRQGSALSLFYQPVIYAALNVMKWNSNLPTTKTFHFAFWVWQSILENSAALAKCVFLIVDGQRFWMVVEKYQVSTNWINLLGNLYSLILSKYSYFILNT